MFNEQDEVLWENSDVVAFRDSQGNDNFEQHGLLKTESEIFNESVEKFISKVVNDDYKIVSNKSFINSAGAIEVELVLNYDNCVAVLIRGYSTCLEKEIKLDHRYSINVLDYRNIGNVMGWISSNHIL